MAELDLTLYLVLKLHWPHNLHTLARLPSCLWLTRFLVRLDWGKIFLLVLSFVCLAWEEVGKHCKDARLLPICHWFLAGQQWIQRFSRGNRIFSEVDMWNCLLFFYILANLLRRSHLLELCEWLPCPLDLDLVFVTFDTESCFARNLILWFPERCTIWRLHWFNEWPRRCTSSIYV